MELYAALDEPNADVDLILGQLADWWHALRTRGEEPVANLNTQEV
jgi:hypothetical protein